MTTKKTGTINVPRLRADHHLHIKIPGDAWRALRQHLMKLSTEVTATRLMSDILSLLIKFIRGDLSEDQATKYFRHLLQSLIP